MNPEESFGRMVRERRRALDLTQEELARRVGCAAITIRKIEADDLRPSVQIAERLAMALAIPLDERAEFVGRARAARPEPAIPVVTPAPGPEEIGREDLSGRAIRGYALGERIGAGGMGAVYRAIQPLVEREVAIKIILPAYANHPDFVRRFEAEAQLVARLEHPHIVPLYDYWREPGVAYLVMRLLRGGSVQTMLQQGSLPLEAVARLLEQICSALHAAHRIGVIHRDLKPGNVLLDEDSNAYLADFGIAKNLGNPNLEDQTQVDMIIGSPYYMSPEQIRSLSVRPQTDIYCLGVMLYEMLTGALPFTGPTPFDLIQQHVSAPLPPLAARQSGLPAALDTVIGRAAAKNPEERYPDVVTLLDDFRRAISGMVVQPGLIPALAEEEGSTAEIVNPYKGLRAFGEADAEDFFGRETLVQQLLARLGEGGDLARFLAVVGPSGSGKSSVVGAGLVPALRRGGLPGSDNWFIVDLLPGQHPFEELEAALLRVAVNPPESLLTQLKDGDRGLLRAVRRILPTDDSVELVLVIDQFEEAFTLVPAEREAERALLLSSLVTAVLDERSRVRVVITLRADFTDRPLRYVDFGELVQKRSEFVLPLTPDELERAILGPARRVGLKLETGLASAIIRDVGDQPGALPLLQYALTELFEKREGRTLTKEAYQSIGGVLGALGRRAEEVYASLDEVGQETARQLFLRLVTLGEGTEDTRRRVLRSELESLSGAISNLQPHSASLRGQSSPISNVVESFGKHRLLSFDRDPITRGPTVEVAHEALLREWPRLREWLSESRADVRLQRQLANAAAEWQSANRDPSFLLGGTRLAQFEGWAASTSIALTQDEGAFLGASVAEREKREADEQARQKRELDDAKRIAEAARKLAETERQSATRLRLRNRVITAVGAVAVVLAVLAGLFGLQSNQNATRAEQNLSTAQIANTQEAAQRATAEAASVLALANAATAQFNEQSRATQQAIAEAESQRAESEKRLAVSRELALAANSNLSVDPERSILLALHALSVTDTREAREALHQAVQTSRLVFSSSDTAWSAAYSPDGTRLAIGGKGLVRVLDTKSREELYSFAGNDDGYNYEITFSPDGKYLAAANDTTLVTVWDAASGEVLFTLSGHTRWVEYIAFSPDGTHIATGSSDNTARVWDADTGQELLTISDHTDTVSSVAFSPDGKRLITGSWDNTVKIRDAETGQVLLVPQGDAARYGLYSPDGTRFVTASSEAVYRMWDADTGQELFTIAPGVAQFAFSADGTRLITGGQDGVLTVWDAATGEKLLTVTTPEFIHRLDISPDGNHVTTIGLDDIMRVWDISPEGSRELFTLAPHGGDWVRRVRYSPDGTRLVTAGMDGTAKVFDAATGDELFTLSGHTDSIFGLAYSPDGTRLATASHDKTAKVWDAASGKLLMTLSKEGHGDGVYGGLFPGILDVAFSADGARIASAGADGTAVIWDAATGEELLTLPGNGTALNNIAFSPDGMHLVTNSGQDSDFAPTATVWDLTTGQAVFTTPNQPNFIFGLAFDNDGARFATGAVDGVLRLWDSKTGEELLALPGHTYTLADIDFSADGQYIATAGFEGIAKVWDAITGKELLTLTGHTGGISGVSFSPDGTRLATSSADGTVRVYLLNIEDLIALAKSRVTRALTTEECQKYLHVEACP